MLKKRMFALLMICLLAVSGMARAAQMQWMNGLAMQVVNEVNLERSRRGLGNLAIDPALTAAAEIRAQEIVRKFSHTRPDGTKWSTVSGVAYGENIARGQKTADKVMAAWMTSDGHRRNILRESYGSIGVACVKEGNIYYWVQLFGK